MRSVSDVTTSMTKPQRMTGPIPVSFVAGVTMLESLQLQRNKFSSTLPLLIGFLTGLTTLRLENNAFTGTLPSQWNLLTKLEELNLSFNNGLTGTIPTIWGDLGMLTELRLGGTGITGTIPVSICSLPSLGIIEVNCSNIVCPAACNCECQQELPVTNTSVSRLGDPDRKRM